jgi:hypothetical protein
MPSMDKPRSFALIIAAVLLLPPVLYVGSYLALVDPSNAWCSRSGERVFVYGYRYFGWSGIGEPPRAASIAPTVFWPLEQIDRRLRAGAWAETIDEPLFP